MLWRTATSSVATMLTPGHDHVLPIADAAAAGRWVSTSDLVPAPDHQRLDEDEKAGHAFPERLSVDR